MALANIEVLTFNEDGSSITCNPGGPGSVRCEIEWGVAPYHQREFVECGQGYYACCYKDWSSKLYAFCVVNGQSAYLP